MSDEFSEPNELANGEKPFITVMLIAAIVATLFAAASILGYHYLVVKRNEFRIATVDIGEVMDIKQLQLTQVALDKSLDDVGREKLYEDVKGFSDEVESALVALQQECQCILIVRAALVKGNTPDLTESLKEKLGMTGIDPVSLAKKVAIPSTRKVDHE